ncbi:MAG: hypothetical protein ACKO23_07420 [Gemmataceae bacterium]
MHVLAYFICENNKPLIQALDHLRVRREVRFREMVDRLKKQGVTLDADFDAGRRVLGRRNLAELLLAQGKVGSIREAFQRYLRDGGVAAVEKTRLPVEQALDLVRKAGGVASLAHPSYHSGMEQDVKELAGFGLGALEVEYPEFTRSQKQSLRELAARYRLAISGGSDCHGPGNREVGSSTISSAELENLRHWSG